MTMQAFTAVTGPAAALLLANVDTDVIIRIEHLTKVSPDDLGRNALAVLRYKPDGSEDPDFVLNQPAFRGAPILLAGPNFGCGSSREQAVWALQGMGIRCIVAPGFGDIFLGNCFQNGVLPVCLPLATVERIAGQCASGSGLTVDLEACTITSPDGSLTSFSIDRRRRDMLLNGLDDIGLTLRDDEKTRAWQVLDRLRRPWAWDVTTRGRASATSHPGVSQAPD